MEPATILVADDEALLLMDYEYALAHAGLIVMAVTSGAKAIEVLKTSGSIIAGVVTDIRFHQLPDGWSVARVAREIDPDMPVVYVSGHGALEWASRGVANSIMLEKPFPIAKLATAVLELLKDRPPRTRA